MSQRTVLPEKLTVAQLLIQFLVFYRKCGVITISRIFTEQHHYYGPYV